MEPDLELVLHPDVRVARRDEVRPELLWGTSLLFVVAFTFLLATLPLSSVLCIGGLGASLLTLAALPWPATDSSKSSLIVAPEEISDPELHDTYCAILSARAELERTLENAPGLASVAPSLNERCTAAVRLCGRIAAVANRPHGYLSSNGEEQIARKVAQLRSRAITTRDAATARDLESAATAYERQLATCKDLAQTTARIQARLDFVLASLRSFAAAVVKQQTAEDEHVALAGESLSDDVEGVRQELAVLASALELDPAAA